MRNVCLCKALPSQSSTEKSCITLLLAYFSHIAVHHSERQNITEEVLKIKLKEGLRHLTNYGIRHDNLTLNNIILERGGIWFLSWVKFWIIDLEQVLTDVSEWDMRQKFLLLSSDSGTVN